MKKTFFSKVAFPLFVWIVGISSVTAQIPTGYYSAAEGKTGAALKTALYEIINPHTVISYNSLWNYWPTTDCMTSNSSQIWDMYSSAVTYFSDHSSMEKEHCAPKSWWNEDDIVTSTGSASTEYSDMFNLYPSNGTANEAKLNYPLSEVNTTTATFNNGVSKVGTSTFSGYTGIAFEPADEYKGDFARTYLYMATCYQTITTWNTYDYCMFQSGTYPTLKPWVISLLLKWSAQDPVSAKETTRNNKVYAIQKNRNPYIDHPELVDYIWGTKNGTNWTSSTAAIKNETTDAQPHLVANKITSGKLQFTSDISNYRYSIISTGGEVVEQGKATGNEISVSNISTGFYLVKITGTNISSVYRFWNNH